MIDTELYFKIIMISLMVLIVVTLLVLGLMVHDWIRAKK